MPPVRAGGDVARLARSRPSRRAPSRRDNGPICITLSGQKTHTGYYADLQGGLRPVNGSHDNAIRGDQFAADKGYAIGSGGNDFFAGPCTHANQPFSPVEAPMGGGNTFTGVCYQSTDIASLEPVQPCK